MLRTMHQYFVNSGSIVSLSLNKYCILGVVVLSVQARGVN